MLDGAWTTGPFQIPTFAIHSVVLPTGKVLIDPSHPPIPNSGPRENAGRAAVWDPTKGTGPSAFRSVPPPLIDADGDGDREPTPVYCSGQTFLPNGELLVAGGNLIWASTPGDGYDTEAGLNRVLTFNPWTETWHEQPQMSHGRWYPTTAELADGRIAILGGYTEQEPGGIYTDELEVFTGSGTFGGRRTIGAPA